jgi:CO/xanthine dehydrogenase FAD-binding subunit
MENFEYIRPDTIEEACSAIQRYDDVEVLSGGQSVLPMLRQRVVSPEYVVDISHLDDEAYIRRDGDQIEIGCLTTYAAIENSSLVVEHCEVLADTVATIGDRQVRNRGTLCGSIAHADPSGDPPVIATALDADIVATGVDGETVYDPDTFFHGFYETALGDELVTAVRLPVLGDAVGAAYEKYEPSEGAYPTATVAAVVKMDGDVIADASVVVGALEPGPRRMDAAAQLDGERPAEDRLIAVAEAVGEDVDPLEDSEGSVAFKSELTKSMTKTAVETAIERAGANAVTPR